MESQYEKYKSHPLWGIVKNGINDLIMNSDIEEKTAIDYIIGYLCMSIIESDQIKIETLNQN